MEQNEGEILYLIQTHKPWKFTEDKNSQTFYDPLQKRIIFLLSYSVYAFELYEKNKDANPIYFMLPFSCKQIEALSISSNDQFMILQDTPLHLNFIDFGPTHIVHYKLSTNHIKEYGISFGPDAGKILGLSFIPSNFVDFIVCHQKGLDLYKYDKSKNTPVNTRTITYKTIGLWINPLKGVIVLSSSVNRGEMQFFQLGKSVKGTTFFLLPKDSFSLDILKSTKKRSEPQTQDLYFEIPQLITKNFKLYVEELKAIKQKYKGYKIHKYFIGELYSKDVLIYYNQSKGIISLYTLNPGQAEKHEHIITLDPRIPYQVQIMDDMMLVYNMLSSLYTIYDPEAEHKLTLPLYDKAKLDLSCSSLYAGDYTIEEDTCDCKTDQYMIINSGFQVNNIVEESEDSIRPYINARVKVKLSFMNDVKKCEHVDTLKKVKGAKEYIRFSINNCISLDSNLLYHIGNKGFFMYEFDRKKYLNEVKKKVIGLMDLMRRTTSKEVILDTIVKFIEERMSLSKLYKLFNRMNIPLNVKETVNQGVNKLESHEVRRITGVMSKQSYLKSNYPTIYSSKTNKDTSFIKVHFHFNGLEE